MTSHAGTDSSPGPDPRRWRALAVLAVVQFLIVVDTTVVNVALPSIRHGLGFSTDGVAWVLNGYLLTAGGLLLLGGRLADLAGRRRMFVAGTALFAVASLSCGLAVDAPMLVASRFLQGAGEALASPAALSLIAVLFTSTGERAKALGIWGALAGIGSTVGVLLSGTFTELLGWRWVFFINLPFAAAALLLAPRLLPAARPSPSGPRRRLDLPGAALATVGPTAVVYGLLASVDHPWSSAPVVTALTTGVVALVAFVVVEARSPEPLVPLGFFANRTRVSANAASVFMIGVMSALFLILTLYMQEVLHYGPLAAGAAYLPFCLTLVAGVGLGLGLKRLTGTRPTLVAAFLTAAAGMLIIGRFPVAGTFTHDLLPGSIVLALGFGLGLPTLQTASLHGVSEEDAGLGSGVQTSVQALANALGIAVLLTTALHRTATRLTTGAPAPEATVAGYRTAFLVGAGCLVLGALVVLALRDDPEPELEPETDSPAIASERPDAARASHPAS